MTVLGYTKTKKEPVRVWVNAPSTHDEYHKYNRMVGHAFTKKNVDNSYTTYLYFAEGPIRSMQFNPIYLEDLNSQTDILKLNK